MTYKDELPPHPNDYAFTADRMQGREHLQLLMEPGRAIAANAGAVNHS